MALHGLQLWVRGACHLAIYANKLMYFTLYGIECSHCEHCIAIRMPSQCCSIDVVLVTGMLASLFKGKGEGRALRALLLQLVLYTLMFHQFANLPIEQPLFLVSQTPSPRMHPSISLAML